MAAGFSDARLRPTRTVLSLIVMAIAGTVLTGWVLDVPTLKTVLPGLTTMKANTAAGLICAAAGLMLVSQGSPQVRRLAAAPALLLAGLAIGTLAEYIAGVRLGIDELLFLDPATTSRPFPGRMSPATAASFLAVSLSLGALSLGARGRVVMAGHLFAAIPAAIGGLSLAGYAYGVQRLYHFGPYVDVALNTAAALSMISVVLVLTRAEEGWARSFRDTPIARMALRRIALLAVVLPFTTGMLVALGMRAGYYQGLFASALFAVAAAAALLWLAFVCATILSRAEREIVLARGLAQHAEGELESSQTRYRALVDGLPQLIWTSNPAGRCDYLSPQWFAYAGEGAPDVSGFAWVADLLHPDDRNLVLQEWGAAVAEQALYDVEVRFRRADGAYRWFKSRAVPVESAGGGPPYWLGTCTDIQEIVEAREILARSQAELEAEVARRIVAQGAAEELRRTAFETSRIFQALLGVDGVILEVNLAGLSTIEARAEDVVGRHVSQSPWFASAGGDIAQIAKVLTAVVDGHMAREEMLLDLPTGRRVFDCGFGPIRNPAGEVVAIMVEAVELTERRAAEAQLIAAREAAERSARAEADFLANMSHELRTPLNSIMGFSSLVADAPELLSETRRRAKLVQGSSQSLLAIVNDILDFSKLDAEGVSLTPEPVELQGLLVSTVDLVRAEAEAKGVRVAIHLTASPSARMLDGVRVRQVLLNLLSNAIKFTHEGCVALSLAELADGRLKVAVRDTGIGIAPAKLEHVFQRFAQADGSTSRTYGGTGLGLAISKMLIEAMGGELGVESEEGRGSCFWFTLDPPLAETSPAAAAETAGAPALAAGLRVLLVDDNPVNRELFCALMRDQGLDIVQAANGAEAVAAVASRGFDIVFMDIQMPGMDGVEATRRIRAMGWDALPIVALTANVMDRHIEAYLAAGMSDHVPKPFVPATIMAALARWTGQGAASEGQEAPSFDSQVLRDLSDAIGREGVDRFLDGVCDQLNGMLALLADPQVGVAGIRETAHSIRGLAGSLGLKSLFEAYTALERSCDDGAGLDELRASAEASTLANASLIQRMRAA